MTPPRRPSLATLALTRLARYRPDWFGGNVPTEADVALFGPVAAPIVAGMRRAMRFELRRRSRQGWDVATILADWLDMMAISATLRPLFRRGGAATRLTDAAYANAMLYLVDELAPDPDSGPVVIRTECIGK